MNETRKFIFIYGLALAVCFLLLAWLDYQYTLRTFTAEIYVVVLCLLFTAFGAWLGVKLTRRTVPDDFAKNSKAQEYLGISERESEVLALLAEGCSNQEIAERLYISLSTVKTHLHKLYQKLDVARRTQAVQKAKELRLVP